MYMLQCYIESCQSRTEMDYPTGCGIIMYLYQILLLFDQNMIGLIIFIYLFIFMVHIIALE